MFDSDIPVYLIILSPIISFLVNSIFIRIFFGTNSKISGLLTIFTISISFLLSLLALYHVNSNGNYEYDSRLWFSFGSFEIGFGILLDQLTAIMLVVVSGVSLLVQIYSIGYMKNDISYVRYYAYMSLFTASMLGLVTSRNLVQLFVFWELVGVTSYLLIGFWMNRPSAANAAKKAFLMTRFGDFGFLFGIMYLASKNPEWLDIPTLYNAVHLPEFTPTVATIFSIALLAGAVGKSAQFPLHSWLPDAMEGPTSVSALIHSATMVTAGVFLIARIFPIISLSDESQIILSFIGAFTVIFAASMALVSNDIKRVLAYSTVSQLGYMMLALGIGAYGPAIFHLLTHAFFKAALFLGSGSLHHSTGTFNLKYMGGMKKIMPVTYWSMLIGSLSLSGIFPLSGFWSKDEILSSLFIFNGFSNGFSFLSPILFFLAIIGVFMTSFYMFRAIFLAFDGEFRGGGTQEKKDLKKKGLVIPETLEDVHKSEAPKVMLIPVLILVFFAIFLGFFVNPVFDIPLISKHWFSNLLFQNVPVFGDNVHHTDFKFLIAIISSIIAIIGIMLAWAIYIKGYVSLPKNSFIINKLKILLDKKYFFDEIYEDKLVNNFLYNRLFKITEVLDLKFLDNINIYLGKFTLKIGELLSIGQTGYLQFYAGGMILGVIILLCGIVLWNF